MCNDPKDATEDESTPGGFHWHAPRTLMVSNIPRWPDAPPHEPRIPAVKLRGMWLHKAGLFNGTRFNVRIMPDGVLLSPIVPSAEPKVRKMGKRQLARLGLLE